jgi:hypothetical protein
MSVEERPSPRVISVSNGHSQAFGTMAFFQIVFRSGLHMFCQVLRSLSVPE